MTRKDYELIAEVLNRLNTDFNNGGSDEVSLTLVIKELSNAFETDNSRFNSEKFLRASGINPKFTERMFTPEGRMN